MFVTEPEAAAIYTAHYMKQQEAETLKVCLEQVCVAPTDLKARFAKASFCVMQVVEQS